MALITRHSFFKLSTIKISTMAPGEDAKRGSRGTFWVYDDDAQVFRMIISKGLGCRRAGRAASPSSFLS
jgi:hypothetical protein